MSLPDRDHQERATKISIELGSSACGHGIFMMGASSRSKLAINS